IKSITSNIPATTRTTQETAPCGGPTALPFLPRAGLNLLITAMVASVHETTRFPAAAAGARRVWRKAKKRASIPGHARRLDADIRARGIGVGCARPGSAERRHQRAGRAV